MTSFSINDFLPVYPSIHPRKDDLYSLFPQGFSQSLYNKKEFNRLIPDLENPIVSKDEKFTPQAQQIYAEQYASYNTPYDSQLIVHSMGLGKTALAVLTAEENMKRGFKGAVIAVPNKKFIMTFITEILKMTGKKYYPDNYNDLNTEELNRALKSSIKKKYKFLTFESFSNNLFKSVSLDAYLTYLKNQPLSDSHAISLKSVMNRIDLEYSDRVIIVDEAHNLRTQPTSSIEKSPIYVAFHLFLHSVKNYKILLLSATPMKDRWDEIADLINLITPISSQLPIKEQFNIEYANDGKTILNEDKLRHTFKGKISTLRTIPSTVKRQFIGEWVQGLKVFKIDECEMSDFQRKYYLEAFNKDRGISPLQIEQVLSNESQDELKDDGESGSKIESKFEEAGAKGIYNASQQAINFVFPDGSYGKAGFDKYTIQSRENIFDKTSNSLSIPMLSPALKNSILASTHEEMLQKLNVFSSKYAKAIRNILEQRKRRGGNTFIYNTLVEGSGLILFARILELFGYQRSVKGVETTPAPRYVILTNKTLDDKGQITADIQKTVNNPNNAQGDYIQVVLGSRTSGEGFSFYNVEEIGILTPFWNYSPIDQAIGRGIRYRSHDEIIKIKGSDNFYVRIHHYAGIPLSNPENSIDMIMYKYSEDKDIKIKRGERFLKEISYDCGNNRLINMKGIDGSRECEYLECDYKCDGIVELDVPEEKLDVSSYYKFYSNKELNVIISKIIKIFSIHFTLEYKNILELLNDHDEFMILKSLKTTIDESIPILNKYGYKSYLKEQHNIYFIVNSMETPSSFLTSYYTINIPVKVETSFEDYHENAMYNESMKFSRKLCNLIEKENFEQAVEKWKLLPIETKESFVKDMVASQIYDEENKIEPSENHIKFRNWIFEINKFNIFYIDKKYVIYFKELKRAFVRDDDEWIRDDQYIQIIENRRKAVLEEVKQNPFGHYGQIDSNIFSKENPKQGFWIADVSIEPLPEGVDQRTVKTGEQCATGSLKKGKLAIIAFKFGLDALLDPVKAKKYKLDTIEDAKYHMRTAKIPENELLEITGNELSKVQRLARLTLLTSEQLCLSIYEVMESKGLIIERT